MSYGFLPGAEFEYLEAVRFYEEQRSGLGAALIAEFERTVALAAEKPNTCRLVHPSGIRRVGLSRFPFAIFFRVAKSNLKIAAFAHHRRRPGYWLTRIGPNP